MVNVVIWYGLGKCCNLIWGPHNGDGKCRNLIWGWWMSWFDIIMKIAAKKVYVVFVFSFDVWLYEISGAQGHKSSSSWTFSLHWYFTLAEIFVTSILRWFYDCVDIGTRDIKASELNIFPTSIRFRMNDEKPSC